MAHTIGHREAVTRLARLLATARRVPEADVSADAAELYFQALSNAELAAFQPSHLPTPSKVPSGCFSNVSDPLGATVSRTEVVLEGPFEAWASRFRLGPDIESLARELSPAARFAAEVGRAVASAGQHHSAATTVGNPMPPTESGHGPAQPPVNGGSTAPSAPLAASAPGAPSADNAREAVEMYVNDHPGMGRDAIYEALHPQLPAITRESVREWAPKAAAGRRRNLAKKTNGEINGNGTLTNHATCPFLLTVRDIPPRDSTRQRDTRDTPRVCVTGCHARWRVECHVCHAVTHSVTPKCHACRTSQTRPLCWVMMSRASSHSWPRLNAWRFAAGSPPFSA